MAKRDGEYEQMLMRCLIATGKDKDLPKSDPCSQTLARLAYLRARRQASSTFSLSDIKASAAAWEHLCDVLNLPAAVEGQEQV